MEDSVLAEVNVRPLKIPKYHGAFEGSSKSINKKGDLKCRKLEDDEYVRQYLQFYYQFQKSEPPAQIVREMTLFAIERQNEAKGTKLVLVEHIQANYQFVNEIASVEVEPPPPMQCEDSEEIAVVFARAGPEDDPGVPFVFHRTGVDPGVPLGWF
ncbi:hypothetical protein Bca52824_004426 [Brassica carinata]|uniref:Uncharacterized protein n=1 Tax=Brassica carinata TaxID=52824 RepID=A0A8X7WPE9_BRACI|nr:hypothetical protein Bca52824_004426 [Brassica carinata]